MCHECSVVVTPDASFAYLGKTVVSHSHSRIAADSGVDIDNCFKFEIEPIHGDWTKEPGIQMDDPNYYIMLDGEPKRHVSGMLERAKRLAWVAFRSHWQERSTITQSFGGYQVRSCDTRLCIYDPQDKHGGYMLGWNPDDQTMEFWYDYCRSACLNDLLNPLHGRPIVRLVSLQDMLHLGASLQKSESQETTGLLEAVKFVMTASMLRRQTAFTRADLPNEMLSAPAIEKASSV